MSNHAMSCKFDLNNRRDLWEHLNSIRDKSNKCSFLNELKKFKI